jgi:hypothetical protein
MSCVFSVRMSDTRVFSVDDSYCFPIGLMIFSYLGPIGVPESTGKAINTVNIIGCFLNAEKGVT